MTNQYQQGDVNIEAIGSIPAGAKPMNSRVVAEGEATGHAHRITGSDVKMYELGDKVIANIVTGDCSIVHEEHGSIDLKPGIYEFRRTPEVDHLTDQVRMIAD